MFISYRVERPHEGELLEATLVLDAATEEFAHLAGDLLPADLPLRFPGRIQWSRVLVPRVDPILDGLRNFQLKLMLTAPVVIPCSFRSAIFANN